MVHPIGFVAHLTASFGRSKLRQAFRHNNKSLLLWSIAVLSTTLLFRTLSSNTEEIKRKPRKRGFIFILVHPTGRTSNFLGVASEGGVFGLVQGAFAESYKDMKSLKEILA